MRILSALLFLLFFTSPVFAKDGTIAVYNRDSVASQLSEYRKACDSLQRFTDLLNTQYEKMNEELYKKNYEFSRDSLLWSPLQRSLKRQDRNNLLTSMRNYKRESAVEIAKVKQNLIDPIYKKINDAAMKIGTEKQYLAVIDQHDAFYWNSETVKIVDINDKLIDELKGK